MTLKVIWFLMVTLNGQELTTQMFQSREQCLVVVEHWRKTDATDARCTDDLEVAWDGLVTRN